MIHSPTSAGSSRFKTSLQCYDHLCVCLISYTAVKSFPLFRFHIKIVGAVFYVIHSGNFKDKHLLKASAYYCVPASGFIFRPVECNFRTQQKGEAMRSFRRIPKFVFNNQKGTKHQIQCTVILSGLNSNCYSKSIKKQQIFVCCTLQFSLGLAWKLNLELIFRLNL